MKDPCAQRCLQLIQDPLTKPLESANRRNVANKMELQGAFVDIYDFLTLKGPTLELLVETPNRKI